MQIFRVLVRGRFAGLEAADRDRLLAAVDDHDVVASGATFTPAGTLAYDGRIDFFSYRVEVRIADDEADSPTAARDAAFARATAVAAADLERRGLAWRHLEPTGSNMADVWN